MAEGVENGPRISIVIAVLNCGKTLQRCIDSIVSQVYSNKEIVIMDGMSEDETVPILEMNSFRITYWESKKDRGIANAWNKALEHASGDWLLFMGGDDRLRDELVLADMATVLAESSIEDIVYGKITFEGGPTDGMVLGEAKDPRFLRRRMFIPHTAAFHRKSYFNEVGNFDETFRIAMDYELLLRKRNILLKFVDRQVTVMGGEGISSKMILASLRENKLAQLKNKVAVRLKIEALYRYFLLRNWLRQCLFKGRKA